MKKSIFFSITLIIALGFSSFGQTIREYNYNVNNGSLSTWYNTPGKIIYPTNYSANNTRTPVIFVHGITGKVSNSYNTNIQQVRNYRLHAAFVQLNPLGTPEQNGKLLKRMIDKVTAHFGAATVSIVAHSKGGMDTERALYGRNPYNNNIPSFGYEKVDAVYTFSSPLRGSRVADAGSALSWTGVAFIAMWYANGYQLTSGSVNSFHNWAKHWRINSTSTFKNYYHQNGASYSRLNMVEDNTTRWWAHQSNDYSYQSKWYYKYVGNPFHKSAGAYLDAYWQWAGLHSGWRNWHTSNDGFIAEYRAKRSIITNNSNALTPGAGDSNYRVMHDANHTSLWEVGENHFSREAAPYLHRGFYGYQGRPSNSNVNNANEGKDLVNAEIFNNVIMASNGNAYFSKNGSSSFIIEEDNQAINLIFYTEKAVDHFTLIDAKGKEITLDIKNGQQDAFTTAYQSTGQINNLPKGVYELKMSSDEFLVMASYTETQTAFAVNMNFADQNGYDGESIEVAILNDANDVDLSKVQVTATVNLISMNDSQTISVDKMTPVHYTMTAMPNNAGHYTVQFPNLQKGAVYGLRIEAIANEGKVLLSRNILHTFYVKDVLAVETVDVAKRTNNTKPVIDKVQIYPNPATDIVNIDVAGVVDAKVLLFNNTGVLVGTYNLNDSKTSINVSNLAKGMYIVKVKTDNEVFVNQLLLK
jgi:hypothetical protein